MGSNTRDRKRFHPLFISVIIACGRGETLVEMSPLRAANRRGRPATLSAPLRVGPGSAMQKLKSTSAERAAGAGGHEE